MATTTNFGWETPDDTDLVKDGAAAMRTLGNSIDTSFVDLKGGTTGQILSKNSNTDLDYLWITNDVGDITAVTAGIGITGGGTSGAVTITNSMATAIDAKGDLVPGTGADTFARLAVGANDTVLTADSSTATGLKWATPVSGAFTQIATGTLSGTTTTISSIPGTYKHLYLRVNNAQIATASAPAFRINGSSGSGYQSRFGRTDSTTDTSDVGTSLRVTTNSIPTSANTNIQTMYIENYALTGWKAFYGTDRNNGNASNSYMTNTNSDAAITSIGITSVAGTANLSVGTYTLFGVN